MVNEKEYKYTSQFRFADPNSLAPTPQKNVLPSNNLPKTATLGIAIAASASGIIILLLVFLLRERRRRSTPIDITAESKAELADTSKPSESRESLDGSRERGRSELRAESVELRRHELEGDKTRARVYEEGRIENGRYSV